MEKKDNNTTCSNDVDHRHENLGRYSELLDVTVKDLKAIKFVNRRTDGFDQEKLKAIETLYARVVKLQGAFFDESTVYIYFESLARETKSYDGGQYVSSIWRINDLYDETNIDIPVLVDSAATLLENIKVYNSKDLPLLEAKNMSDEAFQEMGNHYLNLYKGIKSMGLKINVLRFHYLTHPRSHLIPLLDQFQTSVEDELRQYKDELETTKFRVFELVRKKTNHSRTYLSITFKIVNVTTTVTSTVGSIVLWPLVRRVRRHLMNSKGKKKALGAWLCFY